MAKLLWPISLGTIKQAIKILGGGLRQIGVGDAFKLGNKLGHLAHVLWLVGFTAIRHRGQVR